MGFALREKLRRFYRLLLTMSWNFRIIVCTFLGTHLGQKVHLVLNRFQFLTYKELKYKAVRFRSLLQLRTLNDVNEDVLKSSLDTELIAFI